MKTCDDCGMRLWSTDKGICPTCKPEENRASYGLAPLVKMVPVTINVNIKPNEIMSLGQITIETAEEAQEATLLSDVIKSHVLKVYENSGRHKTKSAKKLGITVKTLYNHLDRYGVV